MKVTPADCLRGIVRPALARLPEKFRAENAERMLISIALHESGLEHRVQIGRDGKPLPHLARGLWQFESIGVRGVMEHPTTGWLRDHLTRYRNLLGPGDVKTIHQMLARSDFLAAWVARGLLWTDPAPLPTADPGQGAVAYAYYDRLWRPGAKRPQAWPLNWALACDACDECRVIAV